MRRQRMHLGLPHNPRPRLPNVPRTSLGISPRPPTSPQESRGSPPPHAQTLQAPIKVLGHARVASTTNPSQRRRIRKVSVRGRIALIRARIDMEVYQPPRSIHPPCHPPRQYNARSRQSTCRPALRPPAPATHLSSLRNQGSPLISKAETMHFTGQSHSDSSHLHLPWPPLGVRTAKSSRRPRRRRRPLQASSSIAPSPPHPPRRISPHLTHRHPQTPTGRSRHRP